MMKHGPVDVVVLAFGEPKFDGRILGELEKQAGTGAIRVLDAMVLFKDEVGESWRMDLEDLPPEERAAVGFIETGTRGLFDSDMAELSARRCQSVSAAIGRPAGLIRILDNFQVSARCRNLFINRY